MYDLYFRKPGKGSPFAKNYDKWDKAAERAEANGILIVDCSENNGFIGPAFFSDLNDVNNVKKCMPVDNYPLQLMVSCVIEKSERRKT